MSVRIEPLRGLRYGEQAGDLNLLIAPPYDNISGEQQLELAARHPHNVVKLILPQEGDPDPWHPAAAARYTEWREQGVLARDSEPCMYLYEIEYQVGDTTHTRHGFLARQRLPETGSDDVRPHENIFEGPMADRLNLYKAVNGVLSPIFEIFKDPRGKALPLLNADQWDMRAKDGFGYTHRLARVTDPGVHAQLAECLARSEVMIADGHHRFTTAMRLRDEYRAERGDQPDAPWNYTLVYFVPVEDPGLNILPTHRLLRLGEDMEEAYVVAQIEKLFEVYQSEQLPVPTGKGELGLVFREGMYRCGLRPDVNLREYLPEGVSDPYAHLDVVLLHSGLLDACLGITPSEYSEKLRYARGAEEAAARVRDGRADAAVLLHGTSVEEVLAVSAGGERMPQKSTDFYPKVLSGLLFYPYE